MRSNKVILFIDSFKKGGAERVCSNYASILFNHNVDVEIWTYNIGDKKMLQDICGKIKVHQFNSMNGTRCLLKIINKFRKETNAIFIAFNHQIALLLIMSRYVTGKKNIIIARNVNYLSKDLYKDTSLKTKVVSFLMTKLYSKCDRFIAQCEAMKQDMINSFNITPSKIKVIYNPLSPQIKKQRVSQECEINTDILFVGRLEKQKGIDKLVRIINYVLDIEKDVTIKIIGNGSLVSLLKEIKRRPGTEIIHLPEVDNMAEHYQNSRMLILTSNYEGFPNVLIEALGSGIPVISFDCPSGPAEIIDDGKNGFLIPVDDYDYYVDRIFFLLKNNLNSYIPEKIENGEKDLLSLYNEVSNEN
ncbi:glycosyltransferase [Escherichia coli]|uniref:Glycosyltransferase n=1 Tax=Escherichia coli TaxID=562 RepID=A0A8I0CCV2_ECOLX|nr:glycosyltransferase [Escherichia coli]MBA7718873.1 glycosyltransferase [Escherichia coli]MBA7963205.1 glycosyltransferase [Escherichia coli]MDF1287868.1 glycosyltransferase [Escherichia coli]SQK50264.1 putative glycosyltransferase WbdM [Escherichia coli]HCO5162040.1 glycosyltransferase [Escherichia coli]